MSERKRNKAGLHKKISSIFKRVPIQQSGSVHKPWAAPEQQRTIGTEPELPAPEPQVPQTTKPQTKRTFQQHGIFARFNKRKAKAMAKAMAKAEEKLRAEVERKVKAEAEKMLLTQHRRYSVLAERAMTQAKEEIAAAKAQVKEKLAKAEEKARTEALARAKAEASLEAEREERHSAENQAQDEIAAAKTPTDEKLAKAEEKARTEALAAQAEEKIRSYAAALAKAEEKLTKAEEKAKTEAMARAKAEEGLLVSAKAETAAGKDESKEQQSLDAQPAETIKTFKRIRRHIFHLRTIKRKFTLLATLAILSIVAFTVSIIKNPPTQSYAGAAIEENPPVAIGDATITQEGTPVKITLMGSDPDGKQLTYNVVTTPSHGSLSGTAPSMTYTPALNYNGPDSFTFSVNNGKADSEQAMMSITQAMMSITVLAVNDAPAITSAPVTTATAGALYTYDVDAADPDAGDTLTYSLTTKPADMTIHSATGLIQ
jgi:hypothetical protein